LNSPQDTHMSHTGHTHDTHGPQNLESAEEKVELLCFQPPQLFHSAQFYTLRHLYKFGKFLYLYVDNICNSVWYFDRIKTTNPKKKNRWCWHEAYSRSIGSHLDSVRVAVRCSVLQCSAVSCRVLHCVAACCSVLQRVAARCSGLEFRLDHML